MKGQELYSRAKQYIPGGTQLLSKRPEMFLPEFWPSYYSRVKGVDVWDLDDRHYIDMTINGVGACILGAADDDVDAAVHAAINSGTMSTLNCPEEVDLAELLVDLHPWSGMVRYARTGGEALAIAIRIARVHTHKDHIAFCGYHGWSDWYLSANLAQTSVLDDHLLPGLQSTGVPRNLQGTTHSFSYGNFKEFDAVISEHHKDLAAIVIEPLRSFRPPPNFLEHIRDVAQEKGIVLIFDEVTSGFRLCTGGVHLTLDVNPDIAVFAKGISNGYPMAVVLGIENIMQSAQQSFISSTYWTEKIGPVAALATIRKHRDKFVHTHLVHVGEEVQKGWLAAAEKTGLSICVDGIPPLSHFSFDHKDGQAAMTLFTQILLEKGFLAGKQFYSTFAHTLTNVENYLQATEEAFFIIAPLLDSGKIVQHLKGPIAHSGFARLA